MRRTPVSSPPNPDEFRSRAREAFAFLIELGFKEERVPGTKNPVAVWFSNGATRVVVEGINWGMNARLALGRAGTPATFENYDLEDLLAVRQAENVASLHAGDQLAQVSQLAAALRTYGTDVLAGDFDIFPQLQACVDQRIAEFRRRDLL